MRASKAAQHLLPKWLKKAVTMVIDYFKGSPCRRDEFQAFLRLIDPDTEYLRIVDYHRVRWLSLLDCVEALCAVLPHLVSFFEREQSNQANNSQTRKKADKLYTELSKPKFSVYLYFLRPQLEILSNLNKLLQTPDQSIHTTYTKIRAYRRLFISPVVIDVAKSIDDIENRLDVDIAIENLPDRAFQDELKKCDDHALLSDREIRNVKNTVISYLHEMGQALEKRFSDEKIFADQCSFLEPLKRNFQKCDITKVMEKLIGEDGSM